MLFHIINNSLGLDLQMRINFLISQPYVMGTQTNRLNENPKHMNKKKITIYTFPIAITRSDGSQHFEAEYFMLQ